VSLARVRWIAVVLLIVVVALLVALCDRQPADRVAGEGAVDEELGPGVQSVVLFFADRAATGMVEERREIVVGEDRASRAKRVLEELARGPREGSGVRTIPAATSINSVFFDDAGGVYVDFSAELLANHPGGSTGELFTIRSVVKTLAANFPDIETVQFLVEGDEIETIAGHLDASEPFDVAQYR
jgi:spore germination protein GerM